MAEAVVGWGTTHLGYEEHLLHLFINNLFNVSIEICRNLGGSCICSECSKIVQRGDHEDCSDEYDHCTEDLES